MINEVLTLDSQFTKSIAFDTTNLYVSSIQFGGIEALRNECTDSIKRASQKIPLNKIQKLAYNEEDDAITIHFVKESGKSKSFHLEGFDVNLRVPFFEALAVSAGIQSLDQTAHKSRNYTPFYLTMAGILIFTTVLAWVASWPRTGRRSDLIKMFQDIGPLGVIIIGGILLLITLYKVYRYGKNPGSQHVYLR